MNLFKFLLVVLFILPITLYNPPIKEKTEVYRLAMPDLYETKKYVEVESLLKNVPKQEKDGFINVLKEFSNKRGLDWRYTLLIMWGESGVNTKVVSGSFVGLIQFGTDARRILGVTKEDLLNMSYTDQAKCAVKIWESNEKWKKIKIDNFIKLQLSTFMPTWVDLDGNPYPASDIIKEQNSAFVNSEGNITKNSILNFFRRKVNNQVELKYFRGKI